MLGLVGGAFGLWTVSPTERQGRFGVRFPLPRQDHENSHLGPSPTPRQSSLWLAL